jgi:hypothetical protein
MVRLQCQSIKWAIPLLTEQPRLYYALQRPIGPTDNSSVINKRTLRGVRCLPKIGNYCDKILSSLKT